MIVTKCGTTMSLFLHMNTLSKEVIICFTHLRLNASLCKEIIVYSLTINERIADTVMVFLCYSTFRVFLCPVSILSLFQQSLVYYKWHIKLLSSTIFFFSLSRSQSNWRKGETEQSTWVEEVWIKSHIWETVMEGNLLISFSSVYQKTMGNIHSNKVVAGRYLYLQVTFLKLPW